SASERAATWEQDGCTVQLDLGAAAEEVSAADGVVTWSWHVELGSGQARSFSFEVVQHEADRPGFLPLRPSPAVPLRAPEAADLSGDAGRLLERSLQDLAGLLLSDDGSPETAFLAAGSPWFFTLFGRDSLLARSEEHTSELQSRENLVCRLLL